MKTLLWCAFAELLAVALSAPLDLIVSEHSPLEVTLSPVPAENTIVQASFRNFGTEVLNIFIPGTVFSNLGVEKLRVVDEHGTRLQFLGLPISLQQTNPTHDDFLLIQPGQVVEITLDPATTHDMSEGGVFEVSAKGHLLTAAPGTTQPSGESISFQSNTITLKVDGASAAKALSSHQPRPHHSKRAIVGPTCTGEDRVASIKQQLSECRDLSISAARAAREGPASMLDEYFKLSMPWAREYIAKRFEAIAIACAEDSTTVQVHCDNDGGGNCEHNIAYAFAFPALAHNIVVCPSYFDSFLQSDCGNRARSIILIHEMSHTPVLRPRALDYAYGYDNLIKLPAVQALFNADTMMYFAQAVTLGC